MVRVCTLYIFFSLSSTYFFEPLFLELAIDDQKKKLKVLSRVKDFCLEVNSLFLRLVPTQAEKEIRKMVENEDHHIRMQRWPQCTVVLFGSTATGLYLPDSDLDFWIINGPCNIADVGKLMRGRPNSFKVTTVLRKAGVPMVKMVHLSLKLPCDISIDFGNSMLEPSPEYQGSVRCVIILLKVLSRMHGFQDTLNIRSHGFIQHVNKRNPGGVYDANDLNAD